jgi:hypothetical protein
MPISNFLAPEKAWLQALCATSKYIEGDSLHTAHIIFLGDNHLDEMQNEWRGGIIDHCGSDGDIVLCETVASRKLITTSEGLPFFCKTKVRCYGWDDAEQYALTGNLMRRMLKLVQKYQSTPPDQIPMEEQRLSHFTQLSMLQSAEIRTQSLIKTALFYLNSLKPPQKIFVIAGSDHLYDDGDSILDHFQLYKATLIIPKTLSAEKDAVTYWNEGFKNEDSAKHAILCTLFQKLFPPLVLNTITDYSI